MIRWKIVVGSAGFGLLLSLMTGAISGVPFGALMLRAFLWGTIFAFIGAVLSYVISRHLPELLTVLPGGPSNDTDKASAVDIVLPDENPHLPSEEDDEGYVVGREGDELDEQGTSVSREAARSAERVSSALVEEVEELEQSDESEDRGGRGVAGADYDSDEVEEGELPELDEDGALFSTKPGGTGGEEYGDISGLSGRRPGVDIQGLEADSEDVAKAIRTVMKKDQKG
jgi:hypothetical protein